MDTPESQIPEVVEPAPVTRIGKYDVIQVLGRGGMGVVYRAIDKQLGREVAIKTLTQGVMNDAGMLARFYEEGRKTGRLKHPHIVTVYDLGDDNGTPYIVMECVEGDPLDKVLRAEEPLSMVDRLRIVEEVCSALGYAHKNNVIHRDVKPANIFVQPDGRAKLLDFGIARLEKKSQDLSLTRAGHIIGTIPYMAPERLRDKFVDGRSDIFSAGIVLFQIITGQLPFAGEDFVLMQKIMNEPHPSINSVRKGLPAGLEAIVDRALAKQADDRYQTGEEMATDLASVISDLRMEQVVEMLPEAQRLVEAGELTRARSVLQQLLKIQSKHPEARELLTEIQRRLTQRQREERLNQVRQQAQDALDAKHFDQSLSIIKDGLDLDSTNSELLLFQDRVQLEKTKYEQIDEFIRQADIARRKSDYKSAIELVQKALSFDKANSKVIALNNALAIEAEHAQRKQRAQAMLDSVRSHLDARRYQEARELLKKVEELDPTHPEVQLLIGDVNAGLEQQRKRQLIHSIEEKVSHATTREQLQEAAQAIQQAIATMPDESALFRLNAQVDRRLQEFENRQLVDNTLQQCRDLRPREALEIVRKARQTLPADERLLSLEALLTERLQKQSAGERRSEYISRAREALKNSQFSDGVHILEACRAEGLATDEVYSLLEFARTEEAEQLRQNLLRSNLEQARSLIDALAFDEAIQFLEQALSQSDDSALRLLLGQATAARNGIQKQADAAVVASSRLARANKLEEALQFLEVLPPEVLRSRRVQAAILALQDQLQQAVFRMTGRAYAALGSDLPGGDLKLRRVAAAAGDSAFVSSVAVAYGTRGRVVADRTLAEAVQACEASLRTKDKAALDGVVQSANAVMPWASPPARASWQTILKKADKKGLLSRPRG